MLRRIPQLDALRGIAILMVILHNARSEYSAPGLSYLFEKGWMGVDLFFVLSGFLITGFLVDTKNMPHAMRTFYARRCLRILPLYYAVLVFMFVVVPFLRPADAHTILERSSPWWAYPMFLQNFLVPVPTMAAGPLAVTWSLAIEEQFYLVWPVVVQLCTRLQLATVSMSVLCLSPLLRLFVSFHGIDLYTNVFCRLDGLMAGSLLALAVRRAAFRPREWVKWAWWCLGVAGPLALVTAALEARWLVFSFTAAASTALVFLAMFSEGKRLQWLMTGRFIVHVGTISYGLYLLHKIAFDAARIVNARVSPIVALGVTLVGCYAMARVSWSVLEKPVMKLKTFV